MPGGMPRVGLPSGALLAADARFLGVLAEYDHVEGGAREDADRAEGVTEAVGGVGAGDGGRPGRATGSWVDGRCTHASMVARRA